MSLSLVAAYDSDSDANSETETVPQPKPDVPASKSGNSKRKIRIEVVMTDEEDEDDAPTPSKGIFAALPPPKTQIQPAKKQKVQASKPVAEELFFTLAQQEQVENIYDNLPSVPVPPQTTRTAHQYYQEQQWTVSESVQEQDDFEVQAMKKFPGSQQFNPAHVKIKQVNQADQTKRSEFEIEMSKEITRARQPTESSFNSVDHDGKKRGRGHILDLVMQAKSRELQLKEQYANQKAAKKTSSAKYGF